MKVAVCIVTFPLSEAGYTPLSNLVKVLSKLSDRVYVVSGGAALEKLAKSNLDNKVKLMDVVHGASSELLMRIINYSHTQLKILRYIIKASGGATLFVFSVGGEDLIIPVLALKLLRKKVIVMPGGIAAKGYIARKESLSDLLSLLANLTYSLADKLILYSPLLIREANLAKYDHKVIIAHEHFVDFNKFAMKKKLVERSNVLGYIGRLSAEKGILNLLNAIPLVLEKRSRVSLVICGDGSQAGEVKEITTAYGLEETIQLKNWIPLEDVPEYLNEFKLLVLPSFTEGLPNVILEAMACGTPVLATSVGAIPDIIKERETGFLLRSNDPAHVANRIVELLDKPELLERVSTNAYKWVRDNFSKEKTLEVWRETLKAFKVQA